MKPRHRRAFFLASFFLFTVIAPVLILSASGYRYDFQEGTLIQTGTLVLKTRPEGARIVINRREQAEKTPAKIQGLPPSRYWVQVEAEHFRPWKKELEVQGSKITLEDHIVLIPKQIPVNALLTEAVRTFAISQDGRKLVYVRKEPLKGDSLWLFDQEENESRLLFPLGPHGEGRLASDGADGTAGTIDRLLWLMDGQGVAFSVTTKKEKRYFMLGLAGVDRGERPYELIPPGSGEIDQWKWTRNGPSLFFLQGGRLYRADYETRSIETIIAEPVQGYATVEESLYFTTASPPSLFKQDLLTGERTKIADLPIEPAEGGEERLILSGRGGIALIDRHQQLWLIDDTTEGRYAPLAAQVESAVFNEGGDRLLYQAKGGLFVHYLEEGTAIPARSAGSFEQVSDKKEPILGPTWYGDQRHILYAAADTVYLSESGGGGVANADPLFRILGETPKFVYHDREDRLYFLFRDRLYQADLSFGRGRSLLGGRL